MSPSKKNSLWAQDTGQNPNMGGEIPKTAPPGMSQSEWDQQLETCKEAGAELVRRQNLPPDQLTGLPDIGGALKMCSRMLAPVENQYQPIRPIYVDPIPLVPVASPTPPSNTLNDASTASTATSSLPIKGNPVPLGLVHLR